MIGNLHAAHLNEASAIALQLTIIGEPVTNIAKYLGGVPVGGLDHFIVHPLAITSGFDNSGPAQIRQMPRDFRLIRFEDFNEIAHADFVASHEIQQAETGSIGQRPKKQFHVESLACPCHAAILARSIHMH